MKPGLNVGAVSVREFTVTPEMCPHFHGVLVHPVVATWTLVYEMEVAGRMMLEPFFDDDEEGVGGGISIEHKSPAPIGSRVAIRAAATEVTPQRLTCHVTAWCRDRLLAEGSFLQVILKKQRLATLIERYQPRSANSG